MPDWVWTLIDLDDYVNYLEAPLGTWAARSTASPSAAIATPSLPHRSTSSTRRSPRQRAYEVPATRHVVTRSASRCRARTDPLTDLDAYGFLDPLKGWGGFGFYFLGTTPPATPSTPGTRLRSSIRTP